MKTLRSTCPLTNLKSRSNASARPSIPKSSRIYSPRDKSKRTNKKNRNKQKSKKRMRKRKRRKKRRRLSI